MTRIRRAHAISLSAAACLLASFCGSALDAFPLPPTRQPNIVLIVADDLGWGAVGCAVWWPGVIEEGRKIDVPVINLDVVPTLARLAGFKPPRHWQNQPLRSWTLAK